MQIVVSGIYIDVQKKSIKKASWAASFGWDLSCWCFWVLFTRRVH